MYEPAQFFKMGASFNLTKWKYICETEDINFKN